MNQPRDMSAISSNDMIDEEVEVIVEHKFVIETLAAALMNFYGDGVEDYEETVHASYGQGSYQYAPRNLDRD